MRFSVIQKSLCVFRRRRTHLILGYIGHIYDRLVCKQEHLRGYLPLVFVQVHVPHKIAFFQPRDHLIAHRDLGGVFFIPCLYHLLRPCPALFHSFHVREDKLVIYGGDVPKRVYAAVHMGYVAVLKAAYHLYDRIHLAYVRQKFVSQTLSLACALDQPRYIHKFYSGGGEFLRVGIYPRGSPACCPVPIPRHNLVLWCKTDNWRSARPPLSVR